MSEITLLNIDCMEYMASCKDKEFDLAIVDPEYGIGRDGSLPSTSKHGGRKAYEFKGWDSKPPSDEYFKELFRVSKNQVIWGANYFTKNLPASMGWIIWDKGQDICSSDAELAFTSFQRALRRKVINRVVLQVEGTIHPTQKPIKLYKWILKNYAKRGDKILDTHAGSRSLAIACYQMGFDHVSCEIDPDYHKDSVERYNKAIAQKDMFEYDGKDFVLKDEVKQKDAFDELIINNLKQ